MKFSLHVFRGNGLIAIIRIPAMGITVGKNDLADVIFPDLLKDGSLFFTPSGSEVIFRVEGAGRASIRDDACTSGKLGHDNSCIWNGYRFLVQVDQEQKATPGNNDFSPGTATVTFDLWTGVLEMTTGMLSVTKGVDWGRSFRLEKDHLVIGTSPGCDIPLSDRYVSSNHATLTLKENGYLLRDLNSTNGTFIGDTRVVEAMLKPESEFRIGKTCLTIKLEVDRVAVSPFDGKQYCGMIGKSDSMRTIFSLLERVAPTRTTVLIEGATGTGKELAARAIHMRSGRPGPFIAINCGAIPRELVESELFGHIRGAFSGAMADRRGVFEMAHGGILFLDEVSELPLALQPRLLRVLEQNTIRKVGDEREFGIDVRVVAATNKDLQKWVNQGQFRQDLYYRLAMIKVTLPPLKERKEDIPELAESFLDIEAKEMSIAPTPLLSEPARQKLLTYPWPGNIRELRNVIRRALILGSGAAELSPETIHFDSLFEPIDFFQTLDQIEKHAIEQALLLGNRKAAAESLGIAVSTLYDKMKKHGIAG